MQVRLGECSALWRHSARQLLMATNNIIRVINPLKIPTTFFLPAAQKPQAKLVLRSIFFFFFFLHSSR